MGWKSKALVWAAPLIFMALIVAWNELEIQSQEQRLTSLRSDLDAQIVAIGTLNDSLNHGQIESRVAIGRVVDLLTDVRAHLGAKR
jgi:hypothetical protein